MIDVDEEIERQKMTNVSPIHSNRKDVQFIGKKYNTKYINNILNGYKRNLIQCMKCSGDVIIIMVQYEYKKKSQINYKVYIHTYIYIVRYKSRYSECIAGLKLRIAISFA